MLKGLWAVTAKEFLHLSRDPATILFALLIPILQLTIFGYALDTDIRHIPAAVLDMDNSRASRDIISRMTATGYFRVVYRASTDEDLNSAIVSGRAKTGIKIPPDYSRRILRRQQAQVLVLVDGSDSQVAFKAQSTAALVGLNASLQLPGASQLAGAGRRIDVRPRTLFNPDMRSANFFVPGLVGLILQIVTTLLTALSIVKEKESGTLEQLMVTPVGRLGLMLGKLAPYFLLGTFETALVLTIMWAVFGVPVNGSLLLLAALVPVCLFSSLGLGLMISTFARTQSEAMQASYLVLLPSVLLSGFIFPRDSMPPLIYPFTTVIPATYFLEILRGIILRGAGWPDLWQQATWLALIGLAVFVAAAARFRKRMG